MHVKNEMETPIANKNKERIKKYGRFSIISHFFFYFGNCLYHILKKLHQKHNLSNKNDYFLIFLIPTNYSLF